MAKTPPPKSPMSKASQTIPRKTSGEKEKPIPNIVTVAAKAMRSPESVTPQQIKSMAARILDDQRNDPDPHKLIKGKAAR